MLKTKKNITKRKITSHSQLELTDATFATYVYFSPWY